MARVNLQVGIALLLCVMVSIFVGCSNDEGMVTQPAVFDESGIESAQNEGIQSGALGKLTVIDAEKRMEKLSKALAEVLGKPGALNVLKESLDEAEKHQVAFPDFVANAAVGRRTIASHMATKMKSSADEVLQLVKSIPNLEVSLPMHCSKLDGQGRLLVTFAPLRDESEVTELIAFDSSGDRAILSAGEVPEDPTLVLALDEDVEYGDADVVPFAKVLIDWGPDWDLMLDQIVIWNDHEPWYKGDPEIYVKVQQDGSGSWRRTNLPGVNEEGHYYDMWQKIRDWQSPQYPGGPDVNSWVYIEVWEDDSWPDSDDRIVWKRHWTDPPDGGYWDPQCFYFSPWQDEYKSKANEAAVWVKSEEYP